MAHHFLEGSFALCYCCVVVVVGSHIGSPPESSTRTCCVVSTTCYVYEYEYAVAATLHSVFFFIFRISCDMILVKHFAALLLFYVETVGFMFVLSYTAVQSTEYSYNFGQLVLLLYLSCAQSISSAAVVRGQQHATK